MGLIKVFKNLLGDKARKKAVDAKADSAKADATKTDVAKQKVVFAKTDATQADATQVDVAKQKVVFAKTDATQADATQVDAVAEKKASSVKADATPADVGLRTTSSVADNLPPSSLHKKKSPSKEYQSIKVATNGKRQKKITELKKELEKINQHQKDIDLIKDAEGKFYCQHESCDQPAVTDSYCRYHYLSGWPRIYARKTLLKEDYLPKAIQELVDIFGESALAFLMRDCKTDKAFAQAIKEMPIITHQKN